MKWEDRYDSLFQYYGARHQVPWRLLKNQARVESSFDPDAENPSTHASGLMQFMGPAAKDVGLKDPRDPEEAIEAAAKYDVWLYGNVLRYLHDHPSVTQTDLWRFAVCSYNCGWGYVREALRRLIHDKQEITWVSFCDMMQTVEYQAPSWPAPRRPRVEQCLPYAESIVQSTVFLPERSVA